MRRSKLKKRYGRSAAAGRRVEATSVERYNGGVRIKRAYGSSTVTRFLVGFAGSSADTWEKIEGFGPTPGDRKTYAINEFLRRHP